MTNKKLFPWSPSDCDKIILISMALKSNPVCFYHESGDVYWELADGSGVCFSKEESEIQLISFTYDDGPLLLYTLEGIGGSEYPVEYYTREEIK